MAKINFGGVVQDARGKQNGLVYSKNGSGSFVRRKVSPSNPRTPAQAAVRSTFATLSKNWSAILTQSNRDAWNAFAKLWPITNVFAASVMLNGLNMYIRLNATLANAGQPGIAVPPANLAVTPIAIVPGALTVNISGPVVDFEQADPDDASGNLFYVFATPPLPPGRTASQSDYRFLSTFPQASVGTPPSQIHAGSAYTALFGTFVAGQRVSLLVSTVDIATGAVSVGQPLSNIAS